MDIPKVGEYYHFWDDGKVSTSRHYICKIERIIPFGEAKNIILNTPRGETFKDGKFENYFIDMSLEDIWKDEIQQYDWLYAKKTDYFIEASCPKYDSNNLWFARTQDGGWFSMNIQSCWQSGRLDIDGNIYNEIIKEAKFPESYSNKTYE